GGVALHGGEHEAAALMEVAEAAMDVGTGVGIVAREDRPEHGAVALAVADDEIDDVVEPGVGVGTAAAALPDNIVEPASRAEDLVEQHLEVAEPPAVDLHEQYAIVAEQAAQQHQARVHH